jgi:EmrB/QacA subfamily drug resistance transporter
MNTEAAPRFSRATKVLSLTAIATFLVSLDTSIVVVARRTIEADLGHPTLLTWVFSGYNIAYAAGLLTAGRFADVNGRKRSFLRGLTLFSIGSVLCGFAPNALFLVLARVIQAIGGAQLTPASIALVLPEFPAEKRTVAIGIWGAVGGLAAAVGPSAGGILVEWLDWRALFFINVPFCIFTLIVGRKLLHESKDPNATKNVDMIGTALGIPAVGLITLSLTQAGEWGWFERRTVGSFLIGLVLLIAFVIRCSRVSNPLLDLSLFKMPFVVAANVSGLFFSIGFLGMWLLNTYWVQAVWHYSPAKSGLATAPGPMMAALLAAPMGRMATRYGHARVLLFGSFLLAIGTFGLGQTMTTTPKFLTIYLPWMLITGAGVGCSISTLSSSASAFLPPARFAMGSALNTTSRQIGSALGAALATSLTISAMATVNKWNGQLMGAKELLATSPAKAQAAFQAIVTPTRSDLASYFNAYRTMAAIYLLAGIIMITLYRKPTERQMAEANDVQFMD